MGDAVADVDEFVAPVFKSLPQFDVKVRSCASLGTHVAEKVAHWLTTSALRLLADETRRDSCNGERTAIRRNLPDRTGSSWTSKRSERRDGAFGEK